MNKLSVSVFLFLVCVCVRVRACMCVYVCVRVCTHNYVCVRQDKDGHLKWYIVLNRIPGSPQTYAWNVNDATVIWDQYDCIVTHQSHISRLCCVCMLSRPVAPVCSALAVTHQDLFLLTAAVTARYLLTTGSAYTFPGFSLLFSCLLIHVRVICNTNRRWGHDSHGCDCGHPTSCCLTNADSPAPVSRARRWRQRWERWLDDKQHERKVARCLDSPIASCVGPQDSDGGCECRQEFVR